MTDDPILREIYQGRVVEKQGKFFKGKGGNSDLNSFVKKFLFAHVFWLGTGLTLFPC